jgi:hypothetical protein
MPSLSPSAKGDLLQDIKLATSQSGKKPSNKGCVIQPVTTSSREAFHYKLSRHASSFLSASSHNEVQFSAMGQPKHAVTPRYNFLKIFAQGVTPNHTPAPPRLLPLLAQCALPQQQQRFF